MSKPADQKTDGKGAKKSGLIDRLTAWLAENADGDADASTADLNAADDEDTSLEPNEGDEGDQPNEDGDINKTEAPDDTKPDGEGKPEKKFTQEEVNKIIADRLAKEKNKKSKMNNPTPDVAARLEAMEKELEGYRESANESTKKEFDALPAEVRELAPGDVATPEGITAIKSWLPKAKKLAETLAAEKKTAKPGNGGDPKILTQKEIEDEKALTEKAKKHSIYRSY